MPAQEQKTTAQQPQAQNPVSTPPAPGANAAQSTPAASTTSPGAIARSGAGEIGGLSQNKLCELKGILPNNVAKNARKAKLTTEEFVRRETGWEKRGKLWYPPNPE